MNKELKPFSYKNNIWFDIDRYVMKNGEVEEPVISSGYLAYFKVDI